MRNKPLLALLIIALIITTILAAILARNALTAREPITITVAWNPGSITDDIVGVMAKNMDLQVKKQNITGANGANGLNAVFAAKHTGKHLLSTSLSAFMAAEAMGFAESSSKDWTGWLTAFSPFVTVVSEDKTETRMLLADAVVKIRAGEKLSIIETLESGEYYGLFVPNTVPQNRLDSLDEIIKTAVDSQEFSEFAKNSGLLVINYSREQTRQAMNDYKP